MCWSRKCRSSAVEMKQKRLKCHQRMRNTSLKKSSKTSCKTLNARCFDVCVLWSMKSAVTLLAAWYSQVMSSILASLRKSTTGTVALTNQTATIYTPT